MLTDEQIEQNKNEIINFLLSTGRNGIEKVISFLCNSGYFYQWGSFRHHAYNGGLAEHSLEVMRYALDNCQSSDNDSIIISALLHDICKVKYDFPEEMELVGHGTRSVTILEKFLNLPLTYEEHNAIRFHMGRKKIFLQRNSDDVKRFKDARKSELWELVHVGDAISAGRYPLKLHKLVRRIIRLINL